MPFSNLYTPLRGIAFIPSKISTFRHFIDINSLYHSLKMLRSEVQMYPANFTPF